MPGREDGAPTTVNVVSVYSVNSRHGVITTMACIQLPLVTPWLRQRCSKPSEASSSTTVSDTSAAPPEETEDSGSESSDDDRQLKAAVQLLTRLVAQTSTTVSQEELEECAAYWLHQSRLSLTAISTELCTFAGVGVCGHCVHTEAARVQPIRRYGYTQAERTQNLLNDRTRTAQVVSTYYLSNYSLSMLLLGTELAEVAQRSPDLLCSSVPAAELVPPEMCRPVPHLLLRVLFDLKNNPNKVGYCPDHSISSDTLSRLKQTVERLQKSTREAASERVQNSNPTQNKDVLPFHMGSEFNCKQLRYMKHLDQVSNSTNQANGKYSKQYKNGAMGSPTCNLVVDIKGDSCVVKQCLDATAASSWTNPCFAAQHTDDRVRGKNKDHAQLCGENRWGFRHWTRGTKATMLPFAIPCEHRQWKTLLPARYTGAKCCLLEQPTTPSTRYAWVTRLASPVNIGVELPYHEWVRDFVSWLTAFEQGLIKAINRAHTKSEDIEVLVALEVQKLHSTTNMQHVAMYMDAPMHNDVLAWEHTVNATDRFKEKSGQLAVSFGMVEPPCISLHKIVLMVESVKRVETHAASNGIVIRSLVSSQQMVCLYEVTTKASIMHMNREEASTLLACQQQAKWPCFLNPNAKKTFWDLLPSHYQENKEHMGVCEQLWRVAADVNGILLAFCGYKHDKTKFVQQECTQQLRLHTASPNHKPWLLPSTHPNAGKRPMKRKARAFTGKVYTIYD